MAIDEDDKQRRNLMAFAGLLCLAWFLRVDLAEVVAGFLRLPQGFDRGRVTLVSGALLLYFVARFACRHGRNEQSDWDALKARYSHAIQRLVTNHLHRSVQSATTSNVDRRLTSLRSHPIKMLLDQRTRSGDQVRLVAMGRGDPMSSAPAGLINVSMDFLVVNDPHQQHASVDVEYQIAPARYTLFKALAAVNSLLLSSAAVNIFFPYYLALGAAASLAT